MVHIEGTRAMKVLVLSLLRIGDLILHQSLIDTFRRAHPGCELTLVVNDSSLSFAKTLAGISEIHVFPRLQLQTLLVEKNRNPHWAFAKLNEFLSVLRSTKYDFVLDFTHTQLSENLRVSLSVPHWPQRQKWAKYFNGPHIGARAPLFSTLELLQRSYGLPKNSSAWIEGRKPEDSLRNKIFLQTTTSEAKKNWPLNSWRALAESIMAQYKEYEMTVLSSPFEDSYLRNFFGLEIPVECVPWESMDQTLSKGRLLITGDTSLQHKASQLQVPLLSLYLGSANLFKIAPTGANVTVLTSNVKCYPCDHGTKCDQERHECADSLTVHDVFSVAMSLLEGKKIPSEKLSCHVQTRINSEENTLRTSTFGGSAVMRAARSFEIGYWQIYLDENIEQGPFGSTAQFILQENNEFLLGVEGREWVARREQLIRADQSWLAQIESQYRSIEPSVLQPQIMKELLNHKLSQAAEAQKVLRNIDDIFFQLAETLNRLPSGFAGLSYLRSALADTQLLLECEMKLIKNLKNEISERGFAYVTGSRKTFENSIGPT